MDKEKEIEKFYLESESCCTLLCTGDDGKKYVEYEDWQRDVNKLQNIIKKLKQEKKQAVKEFADWVIDLLYANSAANEAEQHTHIASTPEELQDEINAKIKELYGEGGADD